MLAAVIQKSTPWWHNFTLSWFDMALAGIIVFGIWRGRRRGMTKELLPSMQWAAILLGAGLGHPLLADVLDQQGIILKLFGNKFNPRTASLLTAYICITVVIFIVFLFVKRRLTAKLEGSNVFGSYEYYWGVVAGLVRYLSMVLVALALLNAPFYTQADIEADKAYKNRWFGGGMKDYSGDFIPSLYDVQDNVFRHSYSGQFIKDQLSIVLINSSPATKNRH